MTSPHDSCLWPFTCLVVYLLPSIMIRSKVVSKLMSHDVDHAGVIFHGDGEANIAALVAEPSKYCQTNNTSKVPFCQKVCQTKFTPSGNSAELIENDSFVLAAHHEVIQNSDLPNTEVDVLKGR